MANILQFLILFHPVLVLSIFCIRLSSPFLSFFVIRSHNLSVSSIAIRYQRRKALSHSIYIAHLKKFRNCIVNWSAIVIDALLHFHLIQLHKSKSSKWNQNDEKFISFIKIAYMHHIWCNYQNISALKVYWVSLPTRICVVQMNGAAVMVW